MVNYRDPSVVTQDTCAYAFAAKLVLGEPADFLQQGQWESSGMPSPGSTCVSAPPRVPAALITYLIITNPCVISSWEFITTLEYEWSVIRGSRPYRWTI